MSAPLILLLPLVSMKQKTLVRALAILGALGIILAALLPSLASM